MIRVQVQLIYSRIYNKYFMDTVKKPEVYSEVRGKYEYE